MFATAAAGFMPAIESTKSTPRASLTRSTLEVNYKSTARWASLLGSLFLVMGTLIIMLPVHNLKLSFAGVFVVIVGFALLVPQMTLVLVRFAIPIVNLVFGSMGNISARGVSRSLSRTGVAIAALSVALATTIGVAVMIDSFRLSVVEWLDNTLNADVFVTAAGINTGAEKGHLDPAWGTIFKNLSEVELVTTTREVQVQTPKGATDMVIVDIPESVFSRFKLVEGSVKTAASRFFLEDALLVSESFAYHNNIGVNDMLALPTDQGIRTFKVVGVYTDYGSERGVVAMHRKVYNNYWSDRSISAIGVYARRGVNADRLTRVLRREIDEQISATFRNVKDQELVVQTNQTLKDTTINIFDRTFVVTEVLRLLTIFVAFVGVVSALMSIQFERKPEIALLRALGMTPPQVWAVISGETGLMGAIAGLLAAPLGVILALVLIFIINRRSFGWTIDVDIDPLIFVQSFLLAITASLIAGIYPALQMSQNNPASGLRED
jgi:putative ABC transport system permease protein